MAGFRKDIGTNVAVPELQMPQTTGDDVGDALQVASFALGAYNMFEQKRQKGIIEDQVQGITNKWQETFEQTGSVLKANLAVNKDIGQLDSGVAFDVAGGVAQRVGFILQGASMGGSGKKEPTRLFDTMTNEQKSSTAGMLGITDYTEPGAIEKIENGFTQMQQSAQILENNTTRREQTERDEVNRVQSFNNSMSDVITFTFNKPINNLLGQMDGLRNLPVEERETAFQDIRTQVLQTKSQLESFVREQNLRAGFKGTALTEAKAKMELQLQRINSLAESLTVEDDERAAGNARMIKAFQDKLNLDAFRSNDIIVQFKEKYGSQFLSNNVDKLLTDPSLLGQTIEGPVLQSLRESLGSAYNLTQEDAQLIKIESVLDVMTGKKTMDDIDDLFAPEDKQRIYQTGYKRSKDSIISGEIFQDEEGMLDAAKGVSGMLEFVDTTNGSEMAKVMDLTNHPNFSKFMDEAPEDLKPILKNQVLDLSERYLRNQVNGGFSQLNSAAANLDIQFDARTNEFKVLGAKEGVFTKRVATGRGTGGSTITVEDNKAKQEAIARANKLVAKINTSFKTLIQNRGGTPGFADLSDAEVASYIMTSGSGVKPNFEAIQVNGKLATLDGMKQRAAEQRKSLQEIQAAEAELEEGANALRQAAETTNFLERAGQSLQNVDLSGMTEEEYEQFKKDLIDGFDSRYRNSAPKE